MAKVLPSLVGAHTHTTYVRTEVFAGVGVEELPSLEVTVQIKQSTARNDRMTFDPRPPPLCTSVRHVPVVSPCVGGGNLVTLAVVVKDTVVRVNRVTQVTTTILLAYKVTMETVQGKHNNHTHPPTPFKGFRHTRCV